MLGFGVSCVIRLDQFGVSFWDQFGISLNLARSLCPHASGVMPLGAQGFLMHFSASSLQYRCLLSKERGDFLSLWGIVERVWDQLCDAFGSVRDQVLGSIGDQFESGP